MAASPHPDLVAALAAARSRVLAAVADACVRSGRAPDEVELVAVSKTVSAERLLAAVAAGLTILGENRVQEAESKAPLVPGARWHLIGPLQSNKARRALELFQTIETVDSLALARRLDGLAGEPEGTAAGWGAGSGAAATAGTRAGGQLGVYLQVNVDRDPGKAGFLPDAIEAALPELAELPNLRLFGLMTVGRQVTTAEAARPTFARLRDLSEKLRFRVPALGPGLSMGMSEDYAVAVEEGATVIRIGRALFGDRPAIGPPR